MSADKQPTLKKRWRRFTRRHAYIAAAIVAGGACAVILLVLFLFRLGYVDRYLANQIKRSFANYGIRAEIRDFHATFPPQTVNMEGIELYDAHTSARLGKI